MIHSKELDPDSEVAVDRLIILFLRSSRWDDLQDLCAMRREWERYYGLLKTVALDTEEDEVKVDLYQRMASVAAYELTDPERAMASYEAILSLRPEEVQTAEALVPYYEGAVEHRKLVDVLSTVVTAKDGRDAMAICHRISQVYETDLEDLQAALTWAGRAVEYVPEDNLTREEFVRLGRETNQLGEVVRLFDEQSQQATGDTRYTLLKQAAELCFVELSASHTEPATKLYSQMLALSPGDTHALEALEVLHTEAQRYQELLEVLRQRLDKAVYVESRVELRLRIAPVQADKLG